MAKRMFLTEEITDKVKSYSEFYKGETHKFIILKNSHASLTKPIINNKNKRYIIIHLESNNGSIYRDYQFPSMKLIAKQGKENYDIRYMLRTLDDIKGLIWNLAEEIKE